MCARLRSMPRDRYAKCPIFNTVVSRGLVYVEVLELLGEVACILPSNDLGEACHSEDQMP